MDVTATATVERTDGRDAGPGVPPAMLTVDHVAGDPQLLAEDGPSAAPCAAGTCRPPTKASIPMATDIKTLKLDQIRTDGGTQPRVAIDDQVVADYAEQYRSGVDLPRVTVFFDGETYWLADGFHRYWANKRINREYVFAEIHQGTLRDAILYSVAANSAHGLRRSIDDKRKAVAIMLTNDMVATDEQGKPWSDREIARRCNVSHGFVAKVREAVMPSHTGNVTSMDGPEASERTFVHPKTGKPTTMNTAKIGRSRASAPKRSGKVNLARNAFKPLPHSEASRVPMRSVKLPLNDPERAARCLRSLFDDDWMGRMAAEVLRQLDDAGRSRPKLNSHIMTVDEYERQGDPATTSAPQPVPQVRGVGIRRAHDAIGILRTIPNDDPTRKEAFVIVRNWIDTNHK